MPDPAFQERLRQAIGTRSKNSVASSAGISEGLLRGYLAGMQPGSDKLVRLAAVLDVSLDWLAAGRGHMRPVASVAAVVPGLEVVAIPLYPVELGAGSGRTVWPAGEPIGVHQVPLATIRRAGLPISALAGFRVQGRSMEPEIMDGEVAVLDLSRTVLPPQARGTYGIRLEDELSLKKLRWTDDGIEVSSVNADEFPPRILPPEDAERLQIIGRFWASFDTRPRTVQE